MKRRETVLRALLPELAAALLALPVAASTAHAAGVPVRTLSDLQWNQDGSELVGLANPDSRSAALQAYDGETGQVLSGSFMDYAMPRADDLPSFEVDSHEVPTKVNPLGAKGVGEAGTVGALPALVNAVNDALAPLGVRHLDMPVTPERVWQAIHAATSAGQSSSA